MPLTILVCCVLIYIAVKKKSNKSDGMLLLAIMATITLVTHLIYFLGYQFNVASLQNYLIFYDEIPVDIFYAVFLLVISLALQKLTQYLEDLSYRNDRSDYLLWINAGFIISLLGAYGVEITKIVFSDLSLLTYIKTRIGSGYTGVQDFPTLLKMQKIILYFNFTLGIYLLNRKKLRITHQLLLLIAWLPVLLESRGSLFSFILLLIIVHKVYRRLKLTLSLILLVGVAGTLLRQQASVINAMIIKTIGNISSDTYYLMQEEFILKQFDAWKIFASPFLKLFGVNVTYGYFAPTHYYGPWNTLSLPATLASDSLILPLIIVVLCLVFSNKKRLQQFKPILIEVFAPLLILNCLLWQFGFLISPSMFYGFLIAAVSIYSSSLIKTERMPSY